MTKEELFKIDIKPWEEDIYLQIKRRWDNIAKPLDGFGDFEALICQIGAINSDTDLDISNKAVIVMCSDNGVVCERVSQSNQDVTTDVAIALGKGVSSVCTLAKHVGAKVYPVDIGINNDKLIPGVLDHKIRKGSGNIRTGAAISEGEALKAIESGISLVKSIKAEGVRIIATGEMGIGNTTTSTAVICALLGTPVDEMTGRGSGLSDSGLINKRQVIRDALKLHSINISTDEKGETLRALCCLGGLDIAALAGVFIGGAVYRIPVIIDGLISAAAALCAEKICPGSKKYMIPSHSGRESGVKTVLDYMDMSPYINGNMALGEGTGAVMMYPIIDMIVNFYRNASEFTDYNMDNYTRDLG